MNKPREWWISEKEGCIDIVPPGDYPPYNDEVHVTEYSAYERVCLERNALKLELCELKAQLAELRYSAERMAAVLETVIDDSIVVPTLAQERIGNKAICLPVLAEYRDKFLKGEK